MVGKRGGVDTEQLVEILAGLDRLLAAELVARAQHKETPRLHASLYRPRVIG